MRGRPEQKESDMKCPGQDSRYWKPGAIFEAKCPECGSEVEFFKDDTTRRCGKCGHRFLNPGLDFGCASYCKFAEQCIGNLPPELIAQREGLLKDRVAVEVKRYFKRDFKKIGHASRVARYAEKIARDERADLAVVLISAYLHDTGINEAGQQVAREMLERLGAGEDLVQEVCQIIGRLHDSTKDETVNFRSVHDADLLADLEEKQKEDGFSDADLSGDVMESLLTSKGLSLAQRALSAKEEAAGNKNPES